MLVAGPFPYPFDYRVPENLSLEVGDVVEVPVGRRALAGVVWGPGAGDVAESKVRPVNRRCDIPPMGEVERRFVDWLCGYTLSAPGQVLKMTLNVPDALETPKPRRVLALAPKPPAIKLTPARQKVFDVLTSGASPMAAGELALAAGCSPAVVTGLAKAGALVVLEIAPTSPAHPQPDPTVKGPKLSKSQSDAAAKLVGAVGTGYSVTLLDGVPGSGKTEVYFEAVAAALTQGKQVLVLLPEIALTAQWLKRFEARFGAAPVEWHSDLSTAKRREAWRGVAKNQVRVVVGARSALFLPFAELGLIVVDEEHDPAFKQEEGVIYHARDMAVVRASLGKIPAVLVSATPSLETVLNAKSGKYGLCHLPERHAGASLPDVALVDMRAEKLPATRWLSEPLGKALQQTLDAGEQAMLFLNRRGYAPLTLCRTCGLRLQCPNCSAWLVEHRQRHRLQCHHCGHQMKPPTHCPECETPDSFAACGPGVERLLEEARERFPDARVTIASSDTLTSPAKAHALIEQIEHHEVDLIIGTQIVAKGYHFPLLTLVGVVDGDLGLAGGDLRAAERTYQLLYQVAGRAGRAEKPGRVLVQTYMPEHAVMQAIAAGDREAFLAAETEARQQFSMPPFGRLVALVVSGPDAARVDEQAARLGHCAPREQGVRVLGPAPAPLALLRGRHRRRLLLMAGANVQPQMLVRAWLARAGTATGVRVQVDVDPQSFL